MATVHPDRPRRAKATTGRAIFDALNFDYLFPAIVFTTALFVLYLSSLAAVIFIAMMGLFFLARPNKISALGRAFPLLIIAAFVLLSAIWSIAPDRTLYYGGEYALTIIVAVQLGTTNRERPTLIGLFTAFFLFGVVNFWEGWRDGAITFWGFYKHDAYVGIMASKNTQADVSALGTMISLTMLIDAARHRSPLLALAALLLIFINLVLIANAQSAGAVVAVLVGSMVVLVLTASRVLPVQARMMSFISTLIAAAALLLTRSIWFEPLFENILKVAGKDSSLTGRTYIWERADVAIHNAPLLGTGFAAFWKIGYLEAEAIWRRMLIANRSGFNFHNTYYEIRVHLGVVGVALYAAVVIPLVVMLVAKTVRAPSPMSVLFTSLALYEATRMNFESIGFGQFHYTTFLIFTALAWATRPGANEFVGPTLRAKSRRPEQWRGA